MTATADKHALEEGADFTPRFDAHGLIVCVTVEAATRQVLMVAYMNQLALDKTIETGEAHYWSRSRQSLWRKGETSGQMQRVVSLNVDCDQDAICSRWSRAATARPATPGVNPAFTASLNAARSRRLVFVQ